MVAALIVLAILVVLLPIYCVIAIQKYDKSRDDK